MKIPFETALYGTFRHLPACSRTPFFLSFFLLNVLTGWGQNSATEVPDYEWVDSEPLPTVTVNISSLSVNTEDVTISIATDPNNFIYTLTFGNGIQKRNPDGSIEDADFITGLNSPLDFAIDSNGYFYVADYSEEKCSENGKIRKYRPDGTFERNIYTGFFRPLSIDVDSDGNIYVAEYNQKGNGCESDELSRISVYNSSGSRILQNTNVFRPYRLAVSQDKTVYLSQEGDKDPAVLTLDNNLNITGRLPNIQSPGSVTVDHFGFIHVVEYAGRIDFSKFINFENLSIPEIQDIAEEIDKGIDDEAYFIRIYDQEEVYKDRVTEEIDFPVDIAFNYCDKMYVDNLNAEGSNTIFGYIPEKLEFDLEIYSRTPSFDITDPEITCPADISVQADPGEDFKIVDYDMASATDLCGVSVEVTEGPEPGDAFPVGITEVVFTATDASGNQSNCTLQVTVEPSDEAPLTILNCDYDTIEFTADENCQYILEDFTDDFAPSDENAKIVQDPQPGTLVSGELTVTLTPVLDGEEGEPCSFTVKPDDITPPEITSCPNDEHIKLDSGETYIVPDYQSILGISDNCDSNPDYSQSPPANTEISETTPVTITVTDASGNPSECNFTIEISEEEKLSISCPDDQNINFDQDCSFELPDYTNEANATPGATITQAPEPGTVLSANTEVTLTATLDGESTSCPFMVIPVDNEKPIINCLGEQTENYDPEVGFVIPDYTSLTGISDNCNLDEVEQTPAEGTTVFGDTELTITATDETGNFETCSFWIRLTEDEVLEISCPENKSGILDDSCNYVVPDFTDQAQVNFNNAVITQDPEPGEIISESTQISLTALADGQQDTCIFHLDLSETTLPVASCFDDFTLQLDSNGEAKISEDDINNNSTDGCGIENFVIDKSNFTSADIGENTVTLTVTDNYGNIDTCSTTVTIEPYAGGGGDFRCLENPITLQLDQSGAASLPLTDLYTGDASGLNLVASQLNFTCDDLGENTIELSWTGESSDSCEITVVVEDNIKPVAEVSFISVTLDANGLAEILPEDLDNGSYDNCEELNFSLSKTRFTCENTGPNTVALTLTDASGNSTTVNTIVFVNANPGTCTEPPRDNDYLFLYPNPTDGLVNISPPWGVTVEQVFIFDKRGRFILSKDFDKSDLEYEFRLDGVQNSVYTLRILTSEGEIIRRLIIRN